MLSFTACHALSDLEFDRKGITFIARFWIHQPNFEQLVNALVSLSSGLASCLLIHLLAQTSIVKYLIYLLNVTLVKMFDEKCRLFCLLKFRRRAYWKRRYTCRVKVHNEWFRYFPCWEVALSSINLSYPLFFIDWSSLLRGCCRGNLASCQLRSFMQTSLGGFVTHSKLVEDAIKLVVILYQFQNPKNGLSVRLRIFPKH